MAANVREEVLFEAMYERVAPLLPKNKPQPKGGRPHADHKACFAGIVYQLRNAIRWNDMPKEYPSGVTCWRRFDRWTKLGLWPKVQKVILEELQAAGKLDLSELALDATFAEARKGGTASAPRNAASATKSNSLSKGTASPSAWPSTRRTSLKRPSASRH